ncbi:MAG: arsenate reductase ArsC [Ferruginibacter sp.]|nr:arsenate reductase ArsC [Ferruginibacter sp.]
MKKILILCTGNSCRSQIAEGYLKYFAKNKAEVYSAGIETHGVNPLAIETMKEDNIDISHHTSNNIEEYRKVDFDFVITVCDNAKVVRHATPTHFTNSIVYIYDKTIDCSLCLFDTRFMWTNQTKFRQRQKSN